MSSGNVYIKMSKEHICKHRRNNKEENVVNDENVKIYEQKRREKTKKSSILTNKISMNNTVDDRNDS